MSDKFWDGFVRGFGGALGALLAICVVLEVARTLVALK